MDNYYLNYCIYKCVVCGYNIQYWTNSWIICGAEVDKSDTHHWGAYDEIKSRDFFRKTLSIGNPNARLLDGQPQKSSKHVSSWVTIIGG